MSEEKMTEGQREAFVVGVAPGQLHEARMEDAGYWMEAARDCEARMEEAKSKDVAYMMKISAYACRLNSVLTVGFSPQKDAAKELLEHALRRSKLEAFAPRRADLESTALNALALALELSNHHHDSLVRDMTEEWVKKQAVTLGLVSTEDEPSTISYEDGLSKHCLECDMYRSKWEMTVDHVACECGCKYTRRAWALIPWREHRIAIGHIAPHVGMGKVLSMVSNDGLAQFWDSDEVVSWREVLSELAKREEIENKGEEE